MEIFYIQTCSSTQNEILEILKENVKKDDVVVTMGAGDVYKIGEMILDK